MLKRFRYPVLALLAIVVLGVGWYSYAPAPPAAPAAVRHNYGKALNMAHNGLPGAARVLYQQLARQDLSPARRASLYVELPNYPSPQALKLAKVDLHHDSFLVRHAAIEAISQLVPAAQLSLLLGPLLEDDDQEMRFHAARAMLGLSPDDLGLYFGPLEKVLDEYVKVLAPQEDDADAQLQLAQVYLHDDDYPQASAALARVLTLDPDNGDARALQIEALDKQGKPDEARARLAEELKQAPQSAFLQHTLGLWLLSHGQSELALLGMTRAVELEPENSDYRYELATTLHQLEQTEAAQRQLDEILRRQPANRKARILLIAYWKETGQLQNVQVLLAELEQQNPDDPALQQGL
ncbi:MAG: tetratricopeptide repeat protein [Pseudomonas sp.]|nr:tetratricopeptide repeat protein [Pseudomonas sp.]